MLSLPSSSSSSHSSSHVSPKEYDVFLSFRGEDTRKSFTDHLYAALKRSGIKTFKDDQKLEAGEAIAPELLKAIRESWCSVIVFSQTYVFSGWCLDELAEIVKQKNEGSGHKIFPIFYDVDPSDLRRQTGRVAEAFAKQEERYKDNKDKTRSWRSALTQVANLKGWHLQDRHESEFIGDIVTKISTKLRQTYSTVPDDLIGIDSHLEELHSKIDIGEDDIRIIGICGMGGIGKTTLARVVYDQMSPRFEAKSFLSDVREMSTKSGLASIQKQLLSQIFPEECFNFFNVHEGSFMISRRLSHKKVLIVIDDVDNIQHLKWLVGRREWFGLGSRIIVTTRDEHVLLSHRVDDVYKPTPLNANEALRLFSLKAFNSNTPENGFMELSERVVEYADGLPLALEVLGSFFCGRDAALWASAIERLKSDSEKDIHDRLRISFDGLKETEKKIFLDIACFFEGEEKDLVVKVLDGCDFFAEIGIDVLVKKSLIKVFDCKYLGMHDLLQEMGRKIVMQESVDEPGKRSRLWEESDTFDVLTKNNATDRIEGLQIDIDIKCWEQRNMSTWTPDAFLKMKKLRLLRVYNLPDSHHDLKYLSGELRLLHWDHYPLRSFPSTFQPYNLVALLIPYSLIEQLWKGKLCLEKLKLVNLEGSENLIKTPDFTMAPNLESLILEGCIKIVDVHPSIGLLRRLKLLSLRDCRSLRSLPTKIGMQSLETLILSGCSNLERLPDQIDRGLECLVELCLDGTGIRDLPSLSGLKRLKTLNLSGCFKVETLPESLQQLESLEELDLSGTAIRKPASFIFELKNLKFLSFRGCKGSPSNLQLNMSSLFKVMQRRSMNYMAVTLPPLLGLTSLTKLDISYCNLCEGDIPCDICCLYSLKWLALNGNKIIGLPANLDRLSDLKYLGLSDCLELKSLPELLTCTKVLNLDPCIQSRGLFANTTECDSIDSGSLWLNNCHGLAENTNIITLLKKQVKAYANAKWLDIVLPGSEIPEWFGHQRDGCSIKIPLPRNISKDSQWIGVAFCCHFGDLVGQICHRAIIHGRKSRQIFDLPTVFCGSNQIRKDHIWLKYWSRKCYGLYSLFSEDRCGGETGHLSSHPQICNPADEVSDELELEVKVGRWEDLSMNFKKIGVRIVYEKDLEDMEEVEGHLLQICNPTSATVEDIPQKADEAETAATGGGARLQRKRNSCEESDSIEDQDRPQPKRLLQQFLSYIVPKKP